uniref:Coiled-coil domain-containing protein 66 n=1 Tax=Amazona collaria TaxID=241587 RepID=A0A8B9J093_9PSIT
MGNKGRASKQALTMRHTAHVLRSTQDARIKQENLTKPRSESRLSMTKGEKPQVTKHSSDEATTKDHSLIFQRGSINRYPDSENPNVLKNKQKPQNPCVSTEDLSSLVCLTQEQLQQILMTVKEGTGSISETENEKQEEIGKIPILKLVSWKQQNMQEENTVTLLQKACEVSSVPDEARSDSSRKQEAEAQPGQKVIKDSWKPADMFTVLAEREREKALLEFRKTQWKKELGTYKEYVSGQFITFRMARNLCSLCSFKFTYISAVPTDWKVRSFVSLQDTLNFLNFIILCKYYL